MECGQKGLSPGEDALCNCSGVATWEVESVGCLSSSSSFSAWMSPILCSLGGPILEKTTPHGVFDLHYLPYSLSEMQR